MHKIVIQVHLNFFMIYIVTFYVVCVLRYKIHRLIMLTDIQGPIDIETFIHA